MTAVYPYVYTSQVGYLPEARKVAVLAPPLLGDGGFVVRDVQDLRRVVYHGELEPVDCPWGKFALADFTPVRQRGFYQVIAGTPAAPSVGETRASFPFPVAEDCYVKTLRMAFETFYRQRCGTSVPGYHPPCHLDDAVSHRTGEQLDLVGGWHSAGDLRKATGSHAFYAYALLELYELLAPDWTTRNDCEGDVLQEFRWGNSLLLKMQDSETGRLRRGISCGPPFHSEDNRWTDNRTASGDERRCTGPASELGHWLFAATEIRAARTFAALDPDYAATCRRAAELCLQHLPTASYGNVLLDGWAALTHLELYGLTSEKEHLRLADDFGAGLLACQQADGEREREGVYGYFCETARKRRPFRHHANPGIPLYVLARLARACPDAERRQSYREAMLRYDRGYVLPMCALTPYGMMPYGLYANSLPGEAVVRPLDGSPGYRFFCWTRERPPSESPLEGPFLQHGQTAHHFSQAAGLLAAAPLLDDEAELRAAAMCQLEWVMGCNPAAACLMTGAGTNTPYPHARFCGPMPGGILNGFIGRESDEPFLHPGNTLDWESTEYWNMHAAWYIMALAILYEDADISL